MRGFVAQLDALKACNARDATALAGCQATLDRGYAAAEATDPATHRFLARLYSEEKVSAAWYRTTYGEVRGTRPRTDALPLLSPDQVVRRATSAAATAGEPVARLATA